MRRCHTKKLLSQRGDHQNFLMKIYDLDRIDGDRHSQKRLGLSWPYKSPPNLASHRSFHYGVSCQPLKIGLPNRKVIFQPIFFRCYVSFREGIFPFPFFGGRLFKQRLSPKKKTYPSKAERNFAAQAKADIEVSWAFRIAGVDVG